MLENWGLEISWAVGNDKDEIICQKVNNVFLIHSIYFNSNSETTRLFQTVHLYGKERASNLFGKKTFVMLFTLFLFLQISPFLESKQCSTKSVPIT